MASGLGQGVRVPWAQLPAAFHGAVVERFGPIVGVTERVGGFSPGAAVRLDVADGSRVFVKAASADVNPDTPGMYRDEARINAWLPADGVAPELLWTYDDAHCVALAFEYVDAETPHLPWRDDDLDRVLATVRRLHTDTTPAPDAAPAIDTLYSEDFSSWRGVAGGPLPPWLDTWTARHLDRLAELEAGWVEAARGDTLLHCDLRADNVLVSDERVAIVDWPFACRGTDWCDIVFFAPSVALQDGPAPDELLRRYGTVPDVDALTALVAALYGFFAVGGARPDPPGLPTVRAYQRAQGAVCQQWLRTLTGLA